MGNIINEAKRFIVNINKKYKIKFAYIFGSQATGKATENSDVDIAIYFNKSYTDIEEAFIRGDIILNIYDNAMIEKIKKGKFYGG